jgi:hypothetical protein
MKLSKVKTHNGPNFTHGIVFSSDFQTLLFKIKKKIKKYKILKLPQKPKYFPKLPHNAAKGNFFKFLQFYLLN